jgi:hypothetical protein
MRKLYDILTALSSAFVENEYNEDSTEMIDSENFPNIS